jgi:hypothetical protein
MRPEHLRDATRKAAETRSHKLGKRLSKGEKTSTKRMATVAAVYTLQPFERIPEDIVGDLRGVVDVDVRGRRPRPENKRVWASVADEMADVIAAAFDDGQRRDPARRKRWVSLVDGNKPQIRLARREAKLRGINLTMVLDIIHVLEYLWNAAWCFFAEGDAGAEAWVTERLRRLLCGEVSLVAAGIRRSATKRKLCAKYRNSRSTASSPKPTVSRRIVMPWSPPRNSLPHACKNWPVGENTTTARSVSVFAKTRPRASTVTQPWVLPSSSPSGNRAQSGTQR